MAEDGFPEGFGLVDDWRLVLLLIGAWVWCWSVVGFVDDWSLGSLMIGSEWLVVSGWW